MEWYTRLHIVCGHVIRMLVYTNVAASVHPIPVIHCPLFIGLVSQLENMNIDVVHQIAEKCVGGGGGFGGFFLVVSSDDCDGDGSGSGVGFGFGSGIGIDGGSGGGGGIDGNGDDDHDHEMI